MLRGDHDVATAFALRQGMHLAFLSASRTGDQDFVRRFLTGTTPLRPHVIQDALLAAAANGHADVVSLLLHGRLRADPTAENNRALVKAAKRGHLAVVQVLLAWSRPDGTGVLYSDSPRLENKGFDAMVAAVVKAGDPDVFRALLQHADAVPYDVEEDDGDREDCSMLHFVCSSDGFRSEAARLQCLEEVLQWRRPGWRPVWPLTKPDTLDELVFLVAKCRASRVIERLLTHPPFPQQQAPPDFLCALHMAIIRRDVASAAVLAKVATFDKRLRCLPIFSPPVSSVVPVSM